MGPSSTSNPRRERVVYDCNIFLQFLLNPNGPAGRCVNIALAGEVELLVSDPILDELLELPEKPVAIKNGIDAPAISRFVLSLLQHATYVERVDSRFAHPIDPDDSCYVDLAINEDASPVISTCSA